MQVFLVNPSNVSFGIAVITPRWLFVLAGATPEKFGTPVLVDETLERMDFSLIKPGDIVGVSVHTGNALRGYEVGKAARAAGATVIYGGIHATLYPDEAREQGEGHAIVSGDGDLIWGKVLEDAAAGNLQLFYNGGRVPGDAFIPARWDLLPQGKYM